MFKFTVIFLLLLILIGIMGGLQTHDDLQQIGQIGILVMIWICGIVTIDVSRALRRYIRRRRMPQ
jgi:hypothetical protein